MKKLRERKAEGRRGKNYHMSSLTFFKTMGAIKLQLDNTYSFYVCVSTRDVKFVTFGGSLSSERFKAAPYPE